MHFNTKHDQFCGPLGGSVRSSCCWTWHLVHLILWGMGHHFMNCVQLGKGKLWSTSHRNCSFSKCEYVHNLMIHHGIVATQHFQTNPSISMESMAIWPGDQKAKSCAIEGVANYWSGCYMDYMGNIWIIYGLYGDYMGIIYGLYI